MKAILMFLVLLSTLSFGQTLPLVVDNSKWFPPVRSQESLKNCTHFSLIYYLKSAIWNKQFNRDPKLEVNQFNHNFVWNQNSHPIYGVSDPESAFYFMKEQGCASISNFSFNEKTTDIKPDFNTREKALVYKSKRIFKGMFFGNMNNGNIDPTEHINRLKDSLNQGKCFVLGIRLYRYFDKMTDKNNVYNCYQGISQDSIYYGHMFTIVGYNDTIKTAQGRGAFQVINSYDKPASGRFYLDYNWFYFDQQSYPYYFLEEDFSSRERISLNINLDNGISGKDFWDFNYLFVDTLLNYLDKKFDFLNEFDYLCNQNHVQVIGVNKNKLKLRSNVIIKPLNNLTADFVLISDLSDLTSPSDFKSVSVVVFDPISVNYTGMDGQSFNSYTRESKLVINKAYLNFLGTDKKIVARVKDFGDTTIITNDFYSVVAGLTLNPFQEQVYVKSCTSVLKRKLITFSIDDLKTDTPPLWVNTPSSVGSVYENSQYSFQFKAQDDESSPITYSLVSGDGAIIDAMTGLFSYKNSKAGTYSFTVKACDGISDIFKTFSIKILSNTLPVFTSEPVSPISVELGTEFKFKFIAKDPQGKPISYWVPTSNTGAADPTSGDYSYTPSKIGTLRVEVWANNGVVNIYSIFTIIVTPRTNSAPTFISIPDTLMGYNNQTYTYQLNADDKENDPLTFSLPSYLPGIEISTGGKITYKLPVGTYKFSVAVSDGEESSITAMTAKIELGTDAAEEITEADYAISIYPNPVMINAKISIFMKKSGTATIAFFDLQGRQIDSVVTEFIAGKNNLEYDASNLRSGVYLCRFTTADSFSKTFKIIKQ